MAETRVEHHWCGKWCGQPHAWTDAEGVPRRCGGNQARRGALLCHHCGKPDEANGDHTCTCPFPDGGCPDHEPVGAPDV